MTNKTLNSETFGAKLYNRFPVKYREDDAEYGYALKRFLESLVEGGFKYSLDEINGLLELLDPSNTKIEVLYALLRQYGFEDYKGVPEPYLRYLLPNLSEAWSKKGSIPMIEFITSSISGIKAITDVTYDDKDNPLVTVRLEMDSNIDSSYFPDTKQLYKILNNFLPFYCDRDIIYSYVFSDSLMVDEVEKDVSDIMEVTYSVINDDSVFDTKTIESLTDLVKLGVIEESFGWLAEDSNEDLYVKSVYVEPVIQKVGEECVSTLKRTTSTNARFFTGTFGSCVFGDDTFKGNIDTIVT